MILIHEAYQLIGLVSLVGSMLVSHRDKIPVRPARYRMAAPVAGIELARNEHNQAGVRRLTHLVDAKKGAA